MFWDNLKHLILILLSVTSVFLVAGVFDFILLNIMVGCDTWRNPECITPVSAFKEFKLPW